MMQKKEEGLGREGQGSPQSSFCFAVPEEKTVSAVYTQQNIRF